MDKLYDQAVLMIEKNQYDKAAILFKKSIKQGNTDSLFSLGILYLQGKGVEKDVEYAISLIMRAKKANHPVAMFYYDIINELED